MKNKLLLCSLVLAGVQAMSELSAQCQAGFTFAVNNNVVTFTHTSTGPSTPSAFWEFGDLSTDWATNPVHIYTNVGTYYVCLTLIDSSTVTPCQSTYCDTIQILYLDSCNANFTYSVSGNTVTFTDQSNPNAIASYWYFGDGATASGQNPVHTYPQPGNYVVCHGISNNTWADSCSVCDTITVGGSPAPCNANFTYSVSGNTVTVNNTSTGNYTSVNWDFGDGTGWITATSNPFSHTYSQPGNYHITLGLADSSGLWYSCDSIGMGVSIVSDSTACNANFSYSASGNTVTFTDLSNPKPVLAWTWDFGDGTTSHLANPVHQYSQTGYYQVCLGVVTSPDSTTSPDSCYTCYTILVIVDSSSTAGIDENTVSVNAVFPNPANDMIEVALSQFVKGELRITDITGSEVYVEKINSDTVRINVSNLLVGYYNLSIQSEAKMIHAKMMIAR